MILTLQVIVFNGKEENIEFQLIKENNLDNDYKKIRRELENKINNLENEISSLKNINSNLIERISKIEKERDEELLNAPKPINPIPTDSLANFITAIILISE